MIQWLVRVETNEGKDESHRLQFFFEAIDLAFVNIVEFVDQFYGNHFLGQDNKAIKITALDLFRILPHRGVLYVEDQYDGLVVSGQYTAASTDRVDASDLVFVVVTKIIEFFCRRVFS